MCHIPSLSPPPPSSQQSRPRTHRCYAARLAHARARRGEGKAHCVLRIYILRPGNKNSRIVKMHGDKNRTEHTGGAVNYSPFHRAHARRAGLLCSPWLIHAQILQVSYDLKAINTGDKQLFPAGQNQASNPPPMTQWWHIIILFPALVILSLMSRTPKRSRCLQMGFLLWLSWRQCNSTPFTGQRTAPETWFHWTSWLNICKNFIYEVPHKAFISYQWC